MAVYNYQCKDCKGYYAMAGTYEVLFAYEPICPHCGSKNAKKLIQKVDVIYKGKGFYNTDNHKTDETIQR